ncbi:hypothetical protein GCM10009641_18830 [Mycobacterium cookii]|uniref:Uncharacterized protein n=1 Tax=Mycobacterium cookii TaxID=1775 RepID=A0A7I7KZZ6_9MYCO|nr:hypothetical protein MCOO_37000 [Mycobacterium cookii]
MQKMCPECLKLINVNEGKFRPHKAKRGLSCPGSGLPIKKALRTSVKVVGGGLPGLGKRGG